MAVPLDSAGRPQPYHHQDDGTTEEKLHGRNNAHYATLKDDAGNVVDTTNRLPTDSVLSGSYAENAVFNATAFTTTGTDWGTTVELDGEQTAGIRVRNTHNQDVVLGLGAGLNITDTTWAYDPTNAVYELTLPASMSGSMFITPDDWPPLRYIKFLRMRATRAIAPTSGNLTAHALARR